VDNETESAVEAFVEDMGLSAQADGLPRIAGRMLGFFIVHGGPFSFSELAERLQVSRGSISTNARILRGLGLIDRTSRPGDRQDYYKLASSPYAKMLEGYVERMQRMEANAASMERCLPNDWRHARRRLREMREFYRAAVLSTRELIAQLRAKEDEELGS